MLVLMSFVAFQNNFTYIDVILLEKFLVEINNSLINWRERKISILIDFQEK